MKSSKIVEISEKELEANNTNNYNNNVITNKVSGIVMEEDKQPPPNILKLRRHDRNIKTSFYPLGLFAKGFGLFPNYDLNFKKCTDHCINHIIKQILEYAYSTLLFILLTIGSILCAIDRPAVLEDMKSGNEETDALVILAVFYMTMAMGILSFFIFPTKFNSLLNFIDHFDSIDKLLEFDQDEKRQRMECIFARKLCLFLVGFFFGGVTIYSAMFILELPNQPKSFTDYAMVVVEVIAGMAMIIPSCLFLFFLNGIKLRLNSFNKKMELLVLPITPSCYSCETYSDYGSELNDKVCLRKSGTIAEDLEKMRILHQEMSELATETSQIFGSHIIRYYLFAILGIILFTYFIIFLREEDLLYWYIYPFLDAFLITKILVVSFYCHSITVEGSCCKKLLNKVCQLRLTSDCASQVQLFIKSLDNPIEITAYGYFTINHGLVTKIIGAIATYFIILVQFKFTDKSSEFNMLKSCNYSCMDLIDFLL